VRHRRTLRPTHVRRDVLEPRLGFRPFQTGDSWRRQLPRSLACERAESRHPLIENRARLTSRRSRHGCLHGAGRSRLLGRPGWDIELSGADRSHCHEVRASRTKPATRALQSGQPGARGRRGPCATWTTVWPASSASHATRWPPKGHTAYGCMDMFAVVAALPMGSLCPRGLRHRLNQEQI
jgi:hypothetical protein